MSRIIGYTIAWIVSLTSGVAAAVVLPRVDEPITVDGDLSDPLWSRALRIEDFYDIRSTGNDVPRVSTIGWAAYDSQYLYIAFRAEDPAPALIRAPQVPRDQVFGDQDMMQIDIDAQDDGKSSTIFRVNARGVQTDGVYTESTEQDDFAPDFDFESATKIAADGWQAELRIPLASIRYARRDPQTWRIVFYRVYPRENRYRFRSSPVERGQTCWLCTAPRFEGITGLGNPKSVVLTPFVTTRVVSPAEGGQVNESDGGLDVKWLAGPSLSVDATLRPDFSQVEADVTQLSVNQRFAIFFPEKRPFFMEGADLLSSRIDAIHTRTITDPVWGARLTGRPGDHAFTLIAADDRGGGSRIEPGPTYSSFETQPGALALIGRYRYSLGQSALGMLLTSREGGGRTNRVFGPDLLWWPTADDRITVQYLESETRDSAPSGGSLADHAAIVEWVRTAANYDWNVTLQDIGADFRADSGFLPQTGVRSFHTRATATAFPKRHLSRLSAGLQFDRADADDGVVSESVIPFISLEGWRGMTAELQLHPGEKIRALDGSVVSADYVTADLALFPTRRFPYLSISLRQGDEVDLDLARVGHGTTLAAYAKLQPADPLYVELYGAFHRLEVDDARLFDAYALSSRVTWALTPRSSLRLVSDGQWITDGDGTKSGFLDATVLYTYRLTWQTSLYIGYGDSRLVEESGSFSDPRREIFVKASYAIRDPLKRGGD
jgi:hypothetical protein